MNLCPCGSNHAYEKCCQPIIQREVTAETAEQMMRARYTAHVVVNLDFIYETTHPDARSDYDFDGTRKWAEESEWLGLEIVNTKDGSVEDDTGEVEFTARFRTREGIRNHHERSSFKRCDGGWVFCQGDMVKSGPVTTSKVGRNDPCPCGSGKKFKKCCG